MLSCIWHAVSVTWPTTAISTAQLHHTTTAYHCTALGLTNTPMIVTGIGTLFAANHICVCTTFQNTQLEMQITVNKIYVHECQTFFLWTTSIHVEKYSLHSCEKMCKRRQNAVEMGWCQRQFSSSCVITLHEPSPVLSHGKSIHQQIIFLVEGTFFDITMHHKHFVASPTDQISSLVR